MTRRVTKSQIKSKIRKAVRDYNRDINRAVDKYNRDVRTQNRRNRQRLINEINRLSTRRTTTSVRYVTYQTSVQTLRESFTRIEAASDQGTWTAGDELFDLAEGETANSIAVLNALDDDEESDGADEASLRQTTITSELSEIDPDLHSRWHGALYSLSPRNPDAARHFCTSVREIFIRILDLKAPDEKVRALMQSLELTQQGQISRRTKIYYILGLYGRQDAELVDFVEQDINNIMELFSAFNPATHGEAGRYSLTQLDAMKVRVEGAIQFLHQSFNA